MGSPILFHIGPVPISAIVVATWGIMAVMIGGSLWAGSRLRLHPSRWQVVLEALILTIKTQISQIMRRDAQPYMPLIGTLGLFILVANFSGFLPAVPAPTG